MFFNTQCCCLAWQLVDEQLIVNTVSGHKWVTIWQNMVRATKRTCRFNNLTGICIPSKYHIESAFGRIIFCRVQSSRDWGMWTLNVQGGPKKRHKVNDTIILQPYIIESCGFEQNVSKEILYMTKVSIWIQQLNILCYCHWQLNYAKTLLPSTARSIKRVTFIFSVAQWNIGRF